ncbi:hypothetical protein [Streptomyces niveus]|uniref:hypothetical protein n=1 Tax=Streptomyces niveus TaxID=193462 RepID=UPI0036C5E5B7
MSSTSRLARAWPAAYADGTGSHRLVLAGAAGPFSDPDGFVWEATAPLTATV